LKKKVTKKGRGDRINASTPSGVDKKTDRANRQKKR